ncbi:unnamed protein product, partial [Nesidiocoris tenuis]
MVPTHRFSQVFNIYIKKAAEIYGIPKTRQIYEKAIEVLTEHNSREMCLRFAEMETKLGEIDRARAIYAHCSQMCDPRVNMMSAQMLSAASSIAGTVSDLAPGAKDDMRLLEAKAVEMSTVQRGQSSSLSSGIMFVRGETQQVTKDGLVTSKAAPEGSNPNEVNLDAALASSDEDDDDDNAADAE